MYLYRFKSKDIICKRSGINYLENPGSWLSLGIDKNYLQIYYNHGKNKSRSYFIFGRPDTKVNIIVNDNKLTIIFNFEYSKGSTTYKLKFLSSTIYNDIISKLEKFNFL